jgi:DNA polymerase-3 subunit delta'
MFGLKKVTGLMWQVIGQDKAVNSLKRSLSEGTLSHAYLFIGPEHVGKMTLAVTLAQALNCTSDDRPCGECSACRRIASGKHPDIHIVRRDDVSESEESAQRKNIIIDQIRELEHSVNLKPYEGGWRIVIIDGAEFMNDEAANALLKTLEEPPDSTIFVLLATDEAALLPTIHSRCRKVEFSPLSIPTVRQALIERWGTPPERADLLGRLSYGAIGWAISATRDDKILEERSESLASLISVGDADIIERFEFANKMATLFGKNRALVRDRLELWLTWWRDLLLMKNGCVEFVTNADRQDILEQQAGKYSLNSIRGIIKSIQETLQQLEQNANPRLALEVLVLNTGVERENNYA